MSRLPNDKPLMDQTLGEAAGNGDGTYNGYLAMRWLYEALVGKPLTDAEVRYMWEQAKQRAAAKRAASNG